MLVEQSRTGSRPFVEISCTKPGQTQGEDPRWWMLVPEWVDWVLINGWALLQSKLSLVFWAPFGGDECVNAKREHTKVMPPAERMWVKWSCPPPISLLPACCPVVIRRISSRLLSFAFVVPLKEYSKWLSLLSLSLIRRSRLKLAVLIVGLKSATGVVIRIKHYLSGAQRDSDRIKWFDMRNPNPVGSLVAQAGLEGADKQLRKD